MYPLPFVVLRYTLYPEIVDVLAVQLNVAVWLVAAPVPVSEMLTGEPLALLVTATVPLSDPAAVGANVTSNVMVWLGARVTGVLALVNVKPAPLSLIPESCALALPVLVTVTGSIDALPVFTLPKLRLVVLNDSVSVAATPVPLSVTVAGEALALLAMLMLPLSVPAAVGLNVTVACADWPAAMVAGVAMPLTAKLVPLAAIEEIVRFAAPLLFSARFTVFLDPTDTLPKLMELSPSDNCACEEDVAVADRFTTTGELPALPKIVIVPVTFPAALGFTATVKLLLCPVPSDSGMDNPDTLNCEFDIVACVMLNATEPVLVTEIACVTCLPTATFPKLMLAVLS